MKTCTKCKETKPLAEFYPRKGYASMWPACRVCKIKQVAAMYIRNKERILRRQAVTARVYRRARLEQYSKYSLAWVKTHPVEDAARAAKRRANKHSATPQWADQDAIRELYALAQRLTRETGIKHHVDHIVPLQHPLVRGLHVEYNLQVIPAAVNVAKGNRHWPDMPR